MEITERLKFAIKDMAGKFKVDIKSVRIKISKPEKELVYEIMKNGEVVGTVNLATALNLGTIETFVASRKLDEIFDNLSMKHKISKNSMNVRIYTKDDKDIKPNLYLFDGTLAKKELNIDELN